MKLSERWLNSLVVLITVLAVVSVASRIYLANFSKEVGNEPTQRDDWRKIAGHGAKIGPDSARVTIVVFSDFQCPYCKAFADNVAQIVRRNANVQLRFRHAPIARLHPFAEDAARASICADSFSKFSSFHDTLFSDQAAIGRRSWSSYAAAVGIVDSLGFVSCMKSKHADSVLAMDKREADRIGVRGTPVILVNETMLVGNPSLDELERLVRSALKSTSKQRD